MRKVMRGTDFTQVMKVKSGADEAHYRRGGIAVTLRKNTMEKILLAMEGFRQNTYAIDFACYLAKLTGSRLTGVFLEGNADGTGPEILHMDDPELVHLDVPEPEDYDLAHAGGADPVLQRVRRFREACVYREVPEKDIFRKNRNMKKMLIPFEGNHYPQELLDFVAVIRPVAPALLTAAFVPQSDYAGMLAAGPVFLLV
jgi:hypothetical protein